MQRMSRVLQEFPVSFRRPPSSCGSSVRHDATCRQFCDWFRLTAFAELQSQFVVRATQFLGLQVQYHRITDAANLDTWRGMSYQTVLTPPEQKTGEVIYPYAKAK